MVGHNTKKRYWNIGQAEHKNGGCIRRSNSQGATLKKDIERLDSWGATIGEA